MIILSFEASVDFVNSPSELSYFLVNFLSFWKQKCDRWSDLHIQRHERCKLTIVIGIICKIIMQRTVTKIKTWKIKHGADNMILEGDWLVMITWPSTRLVLTPPTHYYRPLDKITIPSLQWNYLYPCRNEWQEFWHISLVSRSSSLVSLDLGVLFYPTWSHRSHLNQ